MYLYKKISNFIKRKRFDKYILDVSYKKYFEPFPIQIFESFINKIITQKKYTIIKFDEYSEGCNFIFRSDLDTQLCLENFYKVAKIFNKYNIQNSFFVRVDDMDYDAKNSYNYVKPFLNDFKCGLHSSCYIHDDYVSRLEKEINKFENIFNFKPKFLTLHGFGEYKYNQRQELMVYLSKYHKKLDIDFSDCISKHRIYDYVIQDCHLENNKRYLKNDILNLPPIINNAYYLSLTHPCYWR